MPVGFTGLPVYRDLEKRFTIQLRGRAKARKARALSSLNINAEEMPFAPRDLCRFLQLRIHTADEAAKRDRWVGGRMYNTLSGQSGQYVPMYGTHLRQCLALVLGQIPDGIELRGDYELRLDYAKRALSKPQSQLADS